MITIKFSDGLTPTPPDLQKLSAVFETSARPREKYSEIDIDTDAPFDAAAQTVRRLFHEFDVQPQPEDRCFTIAESSLG